MSPQRNSFTTADLLQRLNGYPAVQRYLVGFSGGADSTALLSALHNGRAELNAEIEAIHFNHGLHPDAQQWVIHCEQFCARRDIPFTCRKLEISTGISNLEASARDLRYSHLEKVIDSKTAYLTAHNADDRAETFLLHALRGSGVEGLASIPELRPLGHGVVARPLLDFGRDALTEFLENEGISWIEDPSNQNLAMDRNFLRHQVIPLLVSRWPAARQSLARSAAHARNTSTALDNLLDARIGCEVFGAFSLPLETVNLLGRANAGFVLRKWIRKHAAPPPPEARLNEFLDQLSSPAPNAQCETSWSGWSVRLFRDDLHLIPPGNRSACPELDWKAGDQLQLGGELGRLQLSGTTHAQAEHWVVGPRRPGAKIRIHPDGPGRSLKKVIQEQPIPPWLRESIPVLYWGSNAVAIGDWIITAQFGDWLAEHELEYQWQPRAMELHHTRQRCHERHGRH